MTPQVFDFISCSLEDLNQYIEFADDNYVTEEQKSQIQIRMCDDNGDYFIPTLHDVLLAPDLCNMLLSIITLMVSGYTCLFQKLFCTVYFVNKKKNSAALLRSEQTKHAFFLKTKKG